MNAAQFHHGPVLVANLALNNSRFLERMNYRNALAEGGRAGEQAAGIV